MAGIVVHWPWLSDTYPRLQGPTEAFSVLTDPQHKLCQKGARREFSEKDTVCSWGNMKTLCSDPKVKIQR